MADPGRSTQLPPLCIVVNGPSAAGKSTLVSGIQDLADRPLLRFGLDELFRMLPDHWGAMPGARHRGFRYESIPGRDGVRRIKVWPDGMRMLFAMNAAVAAILQTGQGVIVDGQAFEPSVNRDLEHRLRKMKQEHTISLAIIELRALDEDLEDRQSRHEHPVGLSLHHNTLPRQSQAPDFVLDTTGRNAPQVRDTIWKWLIENYADGLMRSGTPENEGGVV